MPRRCGIDTSILVRLTTGEPARDFDRVVAALTHRVEVEHVALFASHRVIGEVYVALQHHYAVSKPDAKAALRSVLTSGLVAPSGGDADLQHDVSGARQQVGRILLAISAREFIEHGATSLPGVQNEPLLMHGQVVTAMVLCRRARPRPCPSLRNSSSSRAL